MARYVNADKLLEYLEKEAESEDVKYSFIGAGVQATISVIKTFHLEDVAPVIHADWIGVNPLSDTIECSSCGWEEISSELASRYCPDCGAKMDNWKEMQEDGLPSIERVEVHDG